jgi:hypothetical protein
MIRLWAALAMLWAAPAWAQSESWCRGDARSLERDLTYNGSQLPPNDRLLMERRLNNAERMCSTDSSHARSDLENLRRDMILQAERPPVGGGSWAEPRRKSWE